MTNKRFADLMQEIFNGCLVLAKAKGEDYTKGSADALANFKEGGKALAIDPQKVCWIFLNKHYQAITNYIKTEGKSESEPVAERIKDLINYLVLLAALIEEANGTGPKEGVSPVTSTELRYLENLHTQPDAPESSPPVPEQVGEIVLNGTYVGFDYAKGHFVPIEPVRVRKDYYNQNLVTEMPNEKATTLVNSFEQHGAGDDYPVCPV